MKNSRTAPLILGSASPRRLDLLTQCGMTPDHVIPADIDETERAGELPRDYARRMAVEKAEKLAPDHSGSFILTADTVVAVGRRILPKAENRDQALFCLNALSGRRHHVYGGICLVCPDGSVKQRVCKTLVKFKSLTPQDITAYLDSKEWDGKAGGYAIQGMAQAYIPMIQGSTSNVVGLSLYDTLNMLKGSGFGHSD